MGPGQQQPGHLRSSAGHGQLRFPGATQTKRKVPGRLSMTPAMSCWREAGRQGKWAANGRELGELGRPGGQSFSGNWEADLPESADQTFAALLKRTIEKQVAGFWQSGGYPGNWWFTGLHAKKGL